jgi:polar amino acid transport system permease protein/putative glutamine transport system permease protein
VILPIAFRFAVRPLGSVFVNLVLTTSVLSTITVNDLMSNAENVASETFRPFETYVVVLVLFWLATFAVSAIVNLASAFWLRRSSDRVAVR